MFNINSNKMKEIILIITITFFGFCNAQNPQLFESGWYLQNIIVNGEDNFPPINDENITGILNLSETEPMFTLGMCNQVVAQSLNIDNNLFSFTSVLNTTLGSCPFYTTEDPEWFTNNNYAQLYYNFYNNYLEHSFTYSIIENGSSRTLTITNNNGDQEVFSNFALSTPNYLNLSVSIYPNPVKDFLYLDNNENITINNIELFSILGKKILNINMENNKINLSGLNNGIWFIKIKTDKGTITKKIIKM